jgi:hypothetical protein
VHQHHKHVTNVLLEDVMSAMMQPGDKNFSAPLYSYEEAVVS